MKVLLMRVFILLTSGTVFVTFLLGILTHFQTGSGVSYCPDFAEVEKLLRRLDNAIVGRQHLTEDFLREIRAILDQIGSGKRFSYKNRSKQIVCPERFDVPKEKSRARWVSEECDYGVPIPELVTVILVGSQDRQITLDDLSTNVHRRIPDVSIIAPLVSGNPTLKSRYLYVTYVEVPSSANSGDIWNALVDACKTPYAFMVTDVLNFTLAMTDLERLLRVISGTGNTKLVGGATRNATGHWRAGCYQVTLQNYVLRYRKGYHESSGECMRCDHLDGPFLAERRLLQAVPMDRKLPAAMLLPDFFLKIFRSKSSLLCPDVMMAANDLMTSSAAADKDTWHSLAARWQLNRIQIQFPRSSILHKFNCTELALTCNTEQSRKTLPVCCQEEFARVVGFWAKFAADHGINYQFNSGSALGAVKMEDLMPWDIDGDVFFDKVNYSFVKSSAATFKESGIHLTSFKDPKAGFKYSTWGYIRMTFSGYFIDLFAVPLPNEDAAEKIIRDEVAPPGVNPFNTTKMEIHGVWVTAPPNPGRYARERYGKGILKHSMGWRQTGKDSSWDPYDPVGYFTHMCEDPGHHACLNTMPADGNIFFNVPEY